MRRSSKPRVRRAEASITSLTDKGSRARAGVPTATASPVERRAIRPANDCNTVIGAFLTNLYQCLCCPDPCYQPAWEPAANASFFADYARPRTVTRLRYDNLEAMTRPDRNQFLINQVKPAATRTSPIVNPFAPAPAGLPLPGSGRASAAASSSSIPTARSTRACSRPRPASATSTSASSRSCSTARCSRSPSSSGPTCPAATSRTTWGPASSRSTPRS